MASRDNHLLKSYIQSRESLNICVIMTNNKGKQNFKRASQGIPVMWMVGCWGGGGGAGSYEEKNGLLG